jgi:outer membrane receptor for ferrienterochelin and colicins
VDLQSTLTLFQYVAEDMIEFVPDGGIAATRTAQNARDQDGHGFEWELAWKPIPQLHFSGNYAWQDSRDKATDRPIADAPGRQFMLNTTWEFRPQWQVQGQVNWVADRERNVGDPRPAIDDYTWVNFTLRRERLVSTLDLSLSLRNAFDEDAREPSGTDYPLEGRSAWLELSYSFE